MGVDCPISQKYVPSLNKLRKKYEGQGVAFHAVIPGNVKGRDLQRFKRDYALSFDIRSDPKFKVAKAVSANATPEVFVFDLDHQLRYHGAIDNWFFGLGGYRSAATENYLSDAIDSILAGKTPEVRETKALGCVIQVPL